MLVAALDIETCCNVVGCKFYGAGGSPSTCQHPLSPWHSKITVVGVVGDEGLRRVYRDLSKLRADLNGDLAAYSFIGHNFKFDLLTLIVQGVDLSLDRWIGCTQLMAYVSTTKIDDRWLASYELRRQSLKGAGHRKAGKHSLKTLAPFFLGVPEFWEAEDKDDDEYVLKDAEYTYRLNKILSDMLRAQGEFEFYHDYLLPWTKMLMRAELRGIEIDLDDLAKLEREKAHQAIELKKKLDEQWAKAHADWKRAQEWECKLKYTDMASRRKTTIENSPYVMRLYQNALAKIPTQVDYDSPKQMLWLLKDYYGYDVESLEGDETTAKEVLERLANEGKEDVRIFLEWRQVNKHLTSFIPTYKELTVHGVIHPIFNPSNTRTGRTSAERPNLQQVPPELRRLFKARAGHKLISYDAGAIEAKLIAYYSQDRRLYQILSEGINFHNHNTKVVFGFTEPTEQISALYPKHRKATKNCGFAYFYHAGAKRIRITFTQQGFHFTESESRQILNKLKTEYADAMAFSDSISDHMESGVVVRNLLSRPLRIENPDDAYMKAFNMLIQSSASDLNLHAAFKIQQELDRRGIAAQVLLFVHDSITVEARDEDVEVVEEIVKRNMTEFILETIHGRIQLTVEGGVSDRWEK